MGDLETRIDGSPEGIRAVARWLRKDFGDASEDLASSVFRERSRAASDWTGQTGDAFQDRSKRLGDAGDEAKRLTGQSADDIDQLAQALQEAQATMESVRSDARAGGLVVAGTIVRNPGPGPAEAGPAPTAGTSPAAIDAWDRANRAVAEHNAKVEVWNRCVERANKAYQDWAAALERSATTWQTYNDKLVGVTADFLTAAASVAIIARTVPVLVGQSEYYVTRAAELRAHAEALKAPDGTVVDRNRYYQLLDEADDLEGTRAPQLMDDAKNFKVPSSISRGLGILGVAATGYAIHDDIQQGESVAQAATSNLAGMGASIAAGAYLGGVVGTAIPVPILGTATGVVVGAVAGTVVGAFTSGVIDSVWENGVDSLGDAGDAVMEGLGDVADVGQAVGGAAKDAWDAIF